MKLFSDLSFAGSLTFTEVPYGATPALLAKMFEEAQKTLVFIASDETSLENFRESLAFFTNAPILTLPAWDTLPYDRLSPQKTLMGTRIQTLSKLRSPNQKYIVLTTVSAITQRFAPPEVYDCFTLTFEKGKKYAYATLAALFVNLGFRRVETVRDSGEFALRGSIVDFLSDDLESGYRLDFFGDKLEKVRTFDPLSQRTTGECYEVALHPASEVLLNRDTCDAFRKHFRETFGMKSAEKDPLYGAIAEGLAFPGFEQFLPFFYSKTVTLFDLLQDALFVFHASVFARIPFRFELIQTYYRDRLTEESGTYHPLKPSALYMDPDDFFSAVKQRQAVFLTPLHDGSGISLKESVSDILRLKEYGPKPFERAVLFIGEKLKAGLRVLIASASLGVQERLKAMLHDALGEKAFKLVYAVFPLEEGFIFEKTLYLTEADILGERTLSRKRSRSANKLIQEASELSVGDYVVHYEHGVAAYDGLETLDIQDAKHDCLKLLYLGGDKLYVPVENSNVISRYGPSHASVNLDKLGGISWQGRKEKVKERLFHLAEKLIEMAAKRALEKGDVFVPDVELFQKFCDAFPYVETDDQLRAIEEVLTDMGSGRVMDRLICGDVGFGKTEVALRAAMLAVLSGFQVAIIVPTTLLARQHFQNFQKRFEGFPFRVEQLSRFVTPKQKEKIKKDLSDGHVDIIIGTHALFADSVAFKRLGLMVVDEEQHFGVVHKEKLKRFKAGVHVLTMSATPIPRTLQMSLVGLREMSLITTPPVNRQPVASFVMPYDGGATLKEAIERERSRGGQVFYVVPRVADLPKAEELLLKMLPDIKMTVAHGGMAASELEEAMLSFVDGKYDVLLSTNIVESGIDIPTANTLIVYRADLFGLSQLYQLKGRVGRGRDKGYAYFTTLSNMILAPTTQRRLELLQSLDHLGAGFTLASYDLDLRGAGNVLGDEQSGHIKEVGVELYQNMLQEAVMKVKAQKDETFEGIFTPQIHLHLTVLIPEDYVVDLALRLNLYRRIADLKTRDEVDAFAAEMIDRFGPLPEAVHNLFEIVLLKTMCLETNVEKIDIGPKGAVLSFYQDKCPYGAALIEEITKRSGTMRLRPDQKLVYLKGTENAKARLVFAKQILEGLRALVYKGRET